MLRVGTGRRGLSRSLGERLDLTIISSFFGASEQGAFYDPSDFSTLFQDSAGTTPVTAAGQPVGLMLDKRLGAVRGPEQVSAPNDPTGWTGTNATVTASGGAIRVTNSGAAEGFGNAPGPATGSTATVEVLFNVVALSGPIGVSVQFGGTRVVTAGLGPQRLVITGGGAGTGLQFGTRSATTGHFVEINGVSCRALPGNHATQPTAAARPTLQQDASGLWHLDFDGIDDGLATASIDFSATDKAALWSGLRKNSDASGQVICELGVSSAGNPGFALIQPGVAGQYQGRLFGTTAATLVATTYTAPITNVVTAQFDIAAAALAEISMRVNGAAPGASTPGGDAGTGNLPNTAFNIGRRSGGAAPFVGRLYGLIIRAGAPTAAQIALGERWAASKCGVAL